MTSAFELFKIGIGPSSSHTTGPMLAAGQFRNAIPADTSHVSVELFDSLAWTGKGHGTDTAICLGLMGEEPATVDPAEIHNHLQALRITKSIRSSAGVTISFDPARDIVFDRNSRFPGRVNAMRFRAKAHNRHLVLEKIFYSIGGGFILEHGREDQEVAPEIPYPFISADQLLFLCAEHRLSVAEVQMANEAVSRSVPQIESGLEAIYQAMFDCIDRGLMGEGYLPGNLKVKRRAKALIDKLRAMPLTNQRHPHEMMDWVAAYALAVNEENASGGRVVTAPTNGAAGIIPAVLRYYKDFYPDFAPEQARIYLLSAAAIGSIIKRNASISGAEVGCQGEVGSAASMAAAGLTAVLGGTPEQIENAAEIAMEHHLGLTCDPIGGLVQIPCIERNAFGANKAIGAASLALHGDGTHRVSFDQVIATMRQTGADMQTKYKETSRGGLAVNVPEC